MFELPKFSLGTRVRIVNLPERDLMNDATGIFMGPATLDGYIGIVLLDVATETNTAVALPVVCLVECEIELLATHELVDEETVRAPEDRYVAKSVSDNLDNWRWYVFDNKKQYNVTIELCPALKGCLPFLYKEDAIHLAALANSGKLTV